MITQYPPSDSFHDDWRQLWDLAQIVAAGDHGSTSSAFEPIGLRLEDPQHPAAWRYDATPPDSVTFASTGGDGVHFSAKWQAPHLLVIMTVPMQWDEPNYVVGASLREFLGLGCWHGYFDLEQVAYDRTGFLEHLHTAPRISPDEAAQLELLRNHFELRVWPEVEQRLQELASLSGS
jgi:hypothetical protein